MSCPVHHVAESDKVEALQHEEELKQKTKEAKATLEQRKAERKEIAARNRQAGCAPSQAMMQSDPWLSGSELCALRPRWDSNASDACA